MFQSAFSTDRDTLVETTDRHYTYDAIHATVAGMVPAILAFRPDVIVAIGGGGFVPARMLRSHLQDVPIVAVSLEAYDETDTVQDTILIHQWFDPTAGHGAKVPGGRVLIVDEVDDTRVTLARCLAEVRKSGPAEVAVAVVHNKQKRKDANVPEDVLYIVGEEVPDVWLHYPWDKV